MHLSKYISQIFCWRQAGGKAWNPTHVRRHCIQPDLRLSRGHRC